MSRPGVLRATINRLAKRAGGCTMAADQDELLGTELVLRFSTAKLLDYEADMLIRAAGWRESSVSPAACSSEAIRAGRSSACIVSSTG